MCRLSSFEQFIVTAIIGAALCLCLCLTGCGEAAVPGGTNYAAYESTNPQTGIVTKVIFRGNKDSNLRGLKFSPATGELVIDSLEANGSNLGRMQMEWSIVESQNRALVLGQLIGAVRELVPMLGGGGGASLPVSGGTTLPAVDTGAELRAALLAKIAACPLMQDAQKESLSAAVKVAPANFLQYLSPVVEQAITKVTP